MKLLLYTATVLIVFLTPQSEARFSTDNDDQAKWQYSEGIPVNISLKREGSIVGERLAELLKVIAKEDTTNKKLLGLYQSEPEDSVIEDTRIDIKHQGAALDVTVYVAHKPKNATKGEKPKTTRLHCILTPDSSSCSRSHHMESIHTIPFLIFCLVVLFAFVLGFLKEVFLKRNSVDHELLTDSEETGRYCQKHDEPTDSERNRRDLLAID